jgi:hypothetical protein
MYTSTSFIDCYVTNSLYVCICVQNRSESLLMLLMYGVYCITLHYNTTLEQWAQTLPVPCKRDTPVPQGPQPIVGEESGLMSYRNMEAQKQTTIYTEERNQQQLVALSPEDKNTGGFGSPYTTGKV